MDDFKNKYLSESGNTDDMKKRTKLSDTPGRDEVTEDNKNENPRNENAEEGDIEDLRMQLWNNHIIMSTIMSHLDWRQQLPCELVCRLWRDAVKSAQRTSSLRSYDFGVKLNMPLLPDVEQLCLYVSNLPVWTRPMCVVGFYTMSRPYCCENFSPTTPCNPPCATEHNVIEAMRTIMLSKRADLLAVYGFSLIYKPLPTSHTFQHIDYDLLRNNYFVPFLGLYLPKMPNVNYRTVHYRTERTAREDFYSAVDDICATDVIKGVIVFVQRHNAASLLNYVKTKQPSIPYALGGCVAYTVAPNGIITEEKDTRVTMGVFSVPKEPEPEPGPSCQFNMHSLTISSSVREKAGLRKIIQTFAENVSELQFSAAVQISSPNIDNYHPPEKEPACNSPVFVVQEMFRASFPRTTVVGCMCNKQIGHNHPDIGPQQTEKLHGIATVFVFFSWGKRRASGEVEQHSKQ